MNTFLTKSYKSPEYFIDRKTETAKLLDAIRSERNISASSSVARAVKALIEKGLVIDCNEKGLRVYHVFIQKNLKDMP